MSSCSTPYNLDGGAAANFGNFTLNGSTTVPVNFVGQQDASISFSLKTVGGTPGAFGPQFNVATTPPYSGNSASISFAGGVNTLTGLTNMTVSMVGAYIVISGSATPANNGVFKIASFVSATSVTVANAAGATDASGAVGWSVSALFYVHSNTGGCNDVMNWRAY